jgi:hypothetical protein
LPIGLAPGGGGTNGVTGKVGTRDAGAGAGGGGGVGVLVAMRA